MPLPVLTYASKRETHSTGACVMLWLWAIVDVAGGILLGFLGLVGVALSWGLAGPSAVSLVVGVLGMGLCGWGVKTAQWAIRMHRQERGLARRLAEVVGVILNTAVVFLVAYLAAAVFAIDVPWMGIFLPLVVPHLVAIAALVGTVQLLKKVARAQEDEEAEAARLPGA